MRIMTISKLRGRVEAWLTQRAPTVMVVVVVQWWWQ